MRTHVCAAYGEHVPARTLTRKATEMRFLGLISGAMASGFFYGHGGIELLTLLPLLLVVGSMVLLFEAASLQGERESKARSRLPAGETRLHLR